MSAWSLHLLSELGSSWIHRSSWILTVWNLTKFIGVCKGLSLWVLPPWSFEFSVLQWAVCYFLDCTLLPYPCQRWRLLPAPRTFLPHYWSVLLLLGCRLWKPLCASLQVTNTFFIWFFLLLEPSSEVLFACMTLFLICKLLAKLFSHQLLHLHAQNTLYGLWLCSLSVFCFTFFHYS